MDRYDPYTDKLLRDTRYNILGTNLAEVGTDLISRQAAIADAKSWIAANGFEQNLQNNVIEWLKEFPSAQPKQRTGHWHITDAYPHNVYCSECHKRFAQTHWAVWEDGSLPRNFCPNCGAKMEGVNNESD